jgi:hypothetical protein
MKSCFEWHSISRNLLFYFFHLYMFCIDFCLSIYKVTISYFIIKNLIKLIVICFETVRTDSKSEHMPESKWSDVYLQTVFFNKLETTWVV